MIDKKDLNEDIPTYLRRMMQPGPAENAGEKRHQPSAKDRDDVDIPTFLRKPSRPLPFNEEKGRAVRMKNADFDDGIPRFLRRTKELEYPRCGPDEIQKRIAEMRAIEEEAYRNGKNGFCRICSRPSRLIQIGPCVYAKPCGHRQYYGEL